MKKKIEPKIDRLSDLRVKALGRWNEQLSSGVITRQNGYASYSLLKAILNTKIAAA